MRGCRAVRRLIAFLILVLVASALVTYLVYFNPSIIVTTELPSTFLPWLLNLVSVVVGAFLGALLPIFVKRFTAPNPKFILNLRTHKAELPHDSVPSHDAISKAVSGTILIAEIKNALDSKTNAENCRVRLNIEGVTEGDEYVPWRYLELATGRGSGWSQFHSIQILRGDSGFLHICWTELGENEAYLRTSSPKIQWDPYRLSFNKLYKAKLTIIGDFKPSSWSFTFKIVSWDNIEFSSPKSD